MENYTARHSNYAPLRELDDERSVNPAELTEAQQEVERQASVRNEPEAETTPEPELEPLRPEGGYRGYAQGRGGYVSETTAALKNDHMINREAHVHTSLVTREMGSRDIARSDVEETIGNEQTTDGQDESVTLNPEVSKSVQAYAEAHPDSGATDEELYNAAYFAHSVDDPETYPPRNEEERSLVEERQSYEAIDKVLAERSGEEREVSTEQEQAQMEDRMQAHLGYQQRMSMSMSV